MLLKAKKEIFNTHAGSALSKVKGEGYDFAELSPYLLGSDARKIDWKSSAKTGMPHVKLFFEEKEANIALCALVSGSLLFGGKKEAFLTTLARLGYETLHQAHTLTPIMISATKERFFPPSKKEHALSTFMHQIDSHSFYTSSLQNREIALNINKHLHKKSLVILVGDFLGEFDFSLLAKKHEVVLFIIRDHFEEAPRALGEGEFLDPESGERASFYFGKDAAKAYAKKYHDNDQKLFKQLNKLGIAYQKVVTKESTI